MPPREARELVDLFEDATPDDESASAAPATSWKVLVVDDDEEVHAATRFALQGYSILGRPLAPISAHSAEEAREILAANRDVAVILLDVVMEEHDAGLKFAEWVRAEGFKSQRIILRTGQPGYAPEMDVIRSYDINDYRAKSELTQTRLLTAITSAIRSYDLIEALARRNTDLERFAFAAAHDLQEPLRKVAILSDLVLDSESERLSEPGRGRLKAIHVSAAHMRKLVRGLLEYVATSGDEFETEDVSLAGALAEAASAQAGALDACGGQLESGPLPAVRADHDALVRVLTLLLENAVVYRGDEPLRVQVTAQVSGADVTLAVADNGRGFEPDRRDEIFDAFKRLHRNAEIPGTGLGLSIAKRIVEHQGGRMWAEGEPGRGATFRLALPKARGEAAA
jgi:signal transduction histidine kinase